MSVSVRPATKFDTLPIVSQTPSCMHRHLSMCVWARMLLGFALILGSGPHLTWSRMHVQHREVLFGPLLDMHANPHWVRQ